MPTSNGTLSLLRCPRATRVREVRMVSPGFENDDELQRLELAIEAQEGLRPTLGDAIVDTVVAALRTRLEAARAATRAPSPPPVPSVEMPDRYTVLFADLAGFTSISEQQDPGEVREFLNDLMLELSTAVERYGGLVIKFLGDALVAVFNAASEGHQSTDHSADVERALDAALLMEARAEDLDAEWQERLGWPVRLHIGIEAGGSRSGAAAVDAILVATRLQDLARPGQVLVGPLAQRLTEQRFRYAPISGAEAQGIGLAAHALRGTRTGGTAPQSEPEESVPASERLTQDAEVRQATVVFADLADPARIRRMLTQPELEAFQQDLMHELTVAAERFGGTVERIFGCAVMALFGAPVAHEDDPERALRAALLMRELAEGLSRRWRSRVGADISLQIGINTGRVVAGGIALGTGETYAVTGDTLNTAARLRSVAEPGEVLLGSDTMRLVSHAAETEPLPPLSLKGKSRPVRAYRLLRIRATPNSGRGLHQRGLTSELVGRQAEVQSFRHTLLRLREGHGGVLAVSGEPGLGKSRLCAEMRQLPENREVVWLEGRTLSYSTELSYWPFLQILRQAVGVQDGQDDSAAWAALERRLRELFGRDIAEPLAYLATMLGLEITGELAERVRHLDAEALRRQVFRAARRFFEHLARERPVVLFLEDLHWIDVSSAALAEHLIPLTAEVPLLLGWTARPEAPLSGRLIAAAHATDPERLTQIMLHPLPREHGELLLRNLLGNALSPSLRQTILDKADGNPFFVEEVIRAMVDLGAVSQDRSGGWRATPEAEAMTIPDTVQGVIMARLDRLDDDLKRVLRLASVIGRSFFLRVLRSLAEGEERVEECVSDLTGLELLREKARSPDLEYMFRHALVQETAYETIVRRRRRELHRRVGEAIERLFADRLDELHGLLAYHAARGEDWERAQRYLLRAGDQAARLAADAEALAHYQHAVEACERAFGDQWEPSERAALDRRIGEALFRSGQFPEATRFLTRALERYGRRYPQSKGSTRRAILAQLLQQACHRQLPQLLRRRAPGDPFARDCAEILACLGWIHYTADQELLVFDALSNLNEAERAGDPVSTARGLMAVGVLFGAVGLHRLAGRYHAEAERVGQLARQPVALGQARLGMGMHRFDTGDWEGCLHAMELSRTAYLEAGELRGWGAASAWIFWIAVYQGEFDKALEIAEQMATYGQEAADGQLQRFGLHYRGAALSRSSDLTAAVTNLESAVERYQAIPEVIGFAHAAADLGRCYARLGDLPRARELLEDANRQLDERRLNAGGCVPPRAALAEVYALCAEQAEGDERRSLLLKTRAAARASLRLGRLHFESLMFAYGVLGSCSWLEGRKREAFSNWKRALGVAERLGARYEEARLLLEMGRQTGDEAALERAAALFRQMGSTWERQRTLELLARMR